MAAARKCRRTCFTPALTFPDMSQVGEGSADMAALEGWAPLALEVLHVAPCQHGLHTRRRTAKAYMSLAVTLHTGLC